MEKEFEVMSLEDKIDCYKLIAENRINDLKNMTIYKNELLIKNTNLTNEKIELLNENSNLKESCKELETSYGRLEDNYEDLQEIYRTSREDEAKKINELEGEYEDTRIKLSAIELNYRDALDELDRLRNTQNELARLRGIDELYKVSQQMIQVQLAKAEKHAKNEQHHMELLLDFQKLDEENKDLEAKYQKLAHEFTGLQLAKLAIEDELLKLANKN